MTRQVIWSRVALDDLKSAAAFVARNDAEAGRRIGRTIRARGDALARYDTGRPGRLSGTREKSLTDIGYILAYEVSDKTIVIVRVIHTRHDWPPHPES